MNVNEYVLHGIIHQQDTELRALRRRAQKAEGALEKCARDRDTYGGQRNVLKGRVRQLEHEVARAHVDSENAHFRRGIGHGWN